MLEANLELSTNEQAVGSAECCVPPGPTPAPGASETSPAITDPDSIRRRTVPVSGVGAIRHNGLAPQSVTSDCGGWIESSRLRAAYADDPVQSANIAELEYLIAIELSAMREALDAHEERGREAGLAAVATGEGKAAIDRMTQIDAQALAALRQGVALIHRKTGNLRAC